MRVLYFLMFSFIMSFQLYAQGNLPFDYLGVEYNGTIYQDGETITICSQGGDQEYSFNAEYLPVGLSGNEYVIESIPFTDFYPLEMENWLWPDTDGDGLPNNITDDTWSETYELPFEFCYFGNVFTELQVGTNGRVTFDVGQGFDQWAFNEDDIMPTPFFLGNTIYGVYQDTNPVDGQADEDPDDGDGITNVTYGIYGDAPFRAFVVSYSQMPLFGGGCNALNDEDPIMQTYQIVLHEGTNAIDVIVWNRDSCPAWNGGLGVIALLNDNSTIAYVPDDGNPDLSRNTGTWETENEAWRFIPHTGGPGAANTITWDIDGEFASGDTTLITPFEGNTMITLNNEYYLECTDQTALAAINLEIEYISITIEQEEGVICPGESFTISVVEEYDNYTWYLDDVEIEGETGSSIEVTEGGTYRVEYQHPDCTASDEIMVVLLDQPETIDPEPFYCYYGSDPVEVYLEQYLYQMIDMPASFDKTPYLSMADAEAEQNPITNFDSYPISSGENVFYVRFNYGTNCYVIGTLTVTMASQIPLSAVVVDGCANIVADTFDLTSVQGQHSTDTGLTYSYHNLYAEAQEGENAISTDMVMNYPLNTGTSTVYVRAEDESGCHSITTVTFQIFKVPVAQAVVTEDSVQITGSNTTGPFEYSIDGVTWTTSSTFSNLAPGVYTAYVRSPQGCVGVTSFEIIPIEIDLIPSIITPNGDGMNDQWVIDGIQYFPGSTVKLYDRYGKLILDKVIDGSSDTVWDAVYLDEHLHSTSYWYVIQLSDGREYKGYLVIKNRFKK